MSDRAPKVHYAGPLCYDARGSTAHVLGGFAACYAGDRARRVREVGNHTWLSHSVTCARCLTLLGKRVDCAVHPHPA